jgi:hypothetical protein
MCSFQDWIYKLAVLGCQLLGVPKFADVKPTDSRSATPSSRLNTASLPPFRTWT